jgi:hypothetical protein
LHKGGLFRGTVNFAKNADGTHDTSKSDSCELIDSQGNLVSSAVMLPPDADNDTKLSLIQENNMPHVFHYGILDIDKKIVRNKNFWSKHWSIEAGKHVEIPVDKAEFDFEYWEHGLVI